MSLSRVGVEELVLDPTGGFLSQEVNLDLDSEGSIRREEISDNTSGVGDTLPKSRSWMGSILGLVDLAKFSAVFENFTLNTIQWIF